MKRIYVVRHAKSSWSDMRLQDVERPLNKRGKRDAPVMAKYCAEKGYIPDCMISSKARRAHDTALTFQHEMGIKNTNFRIESSLYHAPEDTYVEVCYGISDESNSVMLFGHNPGITYLANSVGSKYIDNVPTCGVLVIDASVDHWVDLNFNNCQLIDFLYPKMF